MDAHMVVIMTETESKWVGEYEYTFRNCKTKSDGRIYEDGEDGEESDEIKLEAHGRLIISLFQ